MSFILDALKKSESDRQRQSGPSLFEVKVAPPRRTLPLWAVAIAVLLGINVIVISWMLLRHPASQQAATVGTPAAAPPSAMVSQAAPTGTAAPAAPVGQGTAPDTLSGRSPPESARPAGMANGTASAGGTGSRDGTSTGSSGAVAARAPAGASPAAVAPPAVARAASTSQSAAALADTEAHDGGQSPASDDPADDAPAVDPAAAAAGATGAAAGDLPLYQQIVGNDGLPSLHLDLHVFADRPKDRFVMINMHRLGEGDSLPSGVRVDAIRPDGVVLTYHGTRFLLPRN